MSVPPDDSARTAESLDEFQQQIAAARRNNGGVDALWDVAANLGHQISRVRHDVVNIQQEGRVRDYKLFGFEDEGGKGGAFGDIRRDIRDLRGMIQSDKAQVAEEAQATAATLEEKNRAHHEWWSQWWARGGVIVAFLALLLSTILGIISVVRGH